MPHGKHCAATLRKSAPSSTRAARALLFAIAVLFGGHGDMAFAGDGVSLTLVMPASGVMIDLPADVAARWEVEGTLVVGLREAKPIDRLLGIGPANERLVTIEIKRESCGPAPVPGSTSPWPTLGYAGIRTPLPERRAVRSCKAPDLAIELRFPAGVETEPEALLEEANRWERVVAALHAAYGTTRIELAKAIALRSRLVLEAGDGAPDVLAQLSQPFTLLSGLRFERPLDQSLWVLRDLGGHDVLTLLAPSAAGLSLQLLPFGRRYECEEAMAAALKSQLPAPPGARVPPLPPGWKMARAVGSEGVAFCTDGGAGGMIAIGSARLPREVWLPIAAPVLGRIGEVVSR